ncbi:hypothetical Protein psc1_06270 [Candidatus Phytoplasma solani]
MAPFKIVNRCYKEATKITKTNQKLNIIPKQKTINKEKINKLV